MIYGYFIRGEKHAAMARTSIQSVRKADSSAQIIVATDDDSVQFNKTIEVLRFLPGDPIMIANLRAQLLILNAAGRDHQITFLDTDILALKPLQFDPAADLIVTWRDHVLVGADGEKIEGIAATMPYNYGVLGCVKNERTVEAFIWLRERIRRMAPKCKEWFGNQIALAALAGPRPTEGESLDQRGIPWTLTEYGAVVSISKLPCGVWNYTPQKVGEKLTERAFLHFKGGARPLMKSYAKRLGFEWHEEKAAA